MEIIKYNATKNLSVRTAGKSGVKYIVVHYTGGTGSAKNNCDYFQKNPNAPKASADFFIDDTSIYQYNCDLDNKYSWAVGDGGGRNGISNSNSVNIEIVSNGEDFTKNEIEYAAQVVQSLMKTYGVPEGRLVRHHDASGKYCPAPYIDATKWAKLKARLLGTATTATTTTTATNTTAASTNSGKLTVDGWLGAKTCTALQKALGTTADGIISSQNPKWRNNLAAVTCAEWSTNPKGSKCVKALQKKIGVSQDGIMGIDTVCALQRYLAMNTVDGILSPSSATVMELQRRLNAGTF